MYINIKTGEIMTKREVLQYWCKEYDGNDPEQDIPFREVFVKVR